MGNDINKNPKPFTSSGLVPSEIYTGVDAANFMGVPFADPRVLDVIGIAQYGTVYTGGTKKIAEHGGDNPQDRNVPIIVSGNPITDAAGKVSDTPVETTRGKTISGRHRQTCASSRSLLFARASNIRIDTRAWALLVTA